MAGTVLITGSDASNDAGAVVRVDRATGTQTVVSSAGAFSTLRRTWSTVTAPIDCVYLSKTGLNVVPALIDFHTPPPALPT